MNEELSVQCPYCGENWVIEPEPYDGPLEYVEDCHVCCRPVVLRVTYAATGSSVDVRREND